MSISFNDKVAIVTGAGGGLGRCHALELARLGAKVVVNDLGGTMDGSGGSSGCKNPWSRKSRPLAVKPSPTTAQSLTELARKNMVDDAMNAWGRVDVLINNAGILRDKSFSKMTLDDFEMVVNVHLLGAAYCSHAVWPIMREQNYGRILMTTSPSGCTVTSVKPITAPLR